MFWMSTNQLHGKAFEDQLRPGFPGSDTCPQEIHAAFDFPCEHDPQAHLPTSVKTTANGTVCLADARRTFSSPTPFRLLVGTYQQRGPIKEVVAIHEFHIQPEEWEQLKGTLPPAEVAAFHEGIKAFGLGEHKAARAWAKARKAELNALYTSDLQLNPKIDSRSQRRLQSSVALKTLIAGVMDHTCHEQAYRGVPLPLTLPSSSRERRTTAENETPGSAGALGDTHTLI